MSRRPRASGYFRTDYGQDLALLQTRLERVSLVALIVALLAGAGIGELPPIVQPDLISEGLLVEVMPQWHLPLFDLVIAHPRRGHIPRHVRVFKAFATQMAPRLFPALPI